MTRSMNHISGTAAKSAKRFLLKPSYIHGGPKTTIFGRNAATGNLQQRDIELAQVRNLNTLCVTALPCKIFITTSFMLAAMF